MTAVLLEAGSTRTFAAARDWPGWCRPGKTADQALEALAAYLPRYRPVVGLVGVAGVAPPDAAFEVAERLAGTKATDFGVPSVPAAGDLAPVSAEEAGRLAGLVAACWQFLDNVVAASPAELAKGPRGGGRDRDKMYQHVLAAEAAYASKLGLRLKEPQVGDTDGIAAARSALLAVLGAPGDGRPVKEKGWPPRYAARRIAWHVLDHAWEMQDRTPA